MLNPTTEKPGTHWKRGMHRCDADTTLEIARSVGNGRYNIWRGVGGVVMAQAGFYCEKGNAEQANFQRWRSTLYIKDSRGRKKEREATLIGWNCGIAGLLGCGSDGTEFVSPFRLSRSGQIPL